MVHHALDGAVLVRHRPCEALHVGLPGDPAPRVLGSVGVVAGGELVVITPSWEEVLPVLVLVGVFLALVADLDRGRVVQVSFYAGVPSSVRAGPAYSVAVDAIFLMSVATGVRKELVLLSYSREAYGGLGYLTSGCELEWPFEPLDMPQPI